MRPILPIGIRLYHPSASGFTLVETLLVLSMLAVLAGILAPSMLPSASSQLKHNSHLLLSALRDTRLYAQQHRTRASFVIDTVRAEYRVPGNQATHSLVGDITLHLTVAEQEVVDPVSGGIRFYPDGSSTGGRITLSQANLVQHIDVAWLTGAIRVYADAP